MFVQEISMTAAVSVTAFHISALLFGGGLPSTARSNRVLGMSL
jgi:hypothetical protein